MPFKNRNVRFSYHSSRDNINQFCSRYIDARYMHFLIKKRMRSATLGSNTCPIFYLEDGEVEWLGLNAFVQALKRKHSRHKELLSLLTSKLLMHSLSRNRSTELNYAIDASHSSLMWQIKY